MARSYSITVRYNPTTGSLTIEPARQSELILAANTPPIHSLCWSFLGVAGLVAAGWAPAIRFKLEPGEVEPRYCGPFTNLTCTTSSVIASGNTGKGGKYTYRAILQPPVGSALAEIRTARACLFNQVPQPTVAVVRVSVPAGGVGPLQVEPQAVTYTSGQSILWQVDEAAFEDIGQWYPRLVFEDRPGSVNSHFGPFASLDTRDRSILASGSSGGPAGPYGYRFQIVGFEDGKVHVESSPDPTVDDEGDPPDEGG